MLRKVSALQTPFMVRLAGPEIPPRPARAKRLRSRGGRTRRVLFLEPRRVSQHQRSFYLRFGFTCVNKTPALAAEPRVSATRGRCRRRAQRDLDFRPLRPRLSWKAPAPGASAPGRVGAPQAALAPETQVSAPGRPRPSPWAWPVTASCPFQVVTHG